VAMIECGAFGKCDGFVLCHECDRIPERYIYQISLLPHQGHHYC